MKKLLLSFLLMFAVFFTNAQNITSQGFDDITTLTAASWTMINKSATIGTTTWFQGNPAVFNSYSGATSSYIGANYNSTTGNNTISNWLISPPISIQNGDIISFYTKTAVGTTVYPDRLEMRLSTAGAFSTDPATTTTVGDYTILALTVNPSLTVDGFPFDWTPFTYTVSGLTGLVDCRIAFRYFVTSGGPSGANSNFIGIDDFSVDRPVANTQDFFAGNFTMQPNPVTDVFNVTAKSGVSLETIQVLDINGRVVNQVNASNSEATQVNISNLNAGVYFVKVQSDLGVGTSKIIKK